MHVVEVVLAVIGAWLVIAMPVALLVGRFLRIGTDAPQVQQPVQDDSFRSSAA